MKEKMQNATKCLRDNQACGKDQVLSRLVYTEVEGSLKERKGILLSMNQGFLVLMVDHGLFIVPLSSIRTLETTKS